MRNCRQCPDDEYSGISCGWVRGPALCLGRNSITALSASPCLARPRDTAWPCHLTRGPAPRSPETSFFPGSLTTYSETVQASRNRRVLSALRRALAIGMAGGGGGWGQGRLPCGVAYLRQCGSTAAWDSVSTCADGSQEPLLGWSHKGKGARPSQPLCIPQGQLWIIMAVQLWTGGPGSTAACRKSQGGRG